MSNPFLSTSWNSTVSDLDLTGSAINRPLAEKLIVPDISQIMTEQDPDRYPFVRFLEALAKNKATHWKHEWNEERLKAFRTTVKTGSGIIGSAVSTDLQVDDANLFVGGDMIRIQHGTTFENVYVASVTNSTTLVVTRAQSGTTALATIAAADEVIHLGSASAENAGAPDGDHIDPTPIYNIVQIFRDAVELSEDAINLKYFNWSDIEKKQLKDAAQKHLEKMERAFLLGERSYNSGKRTTGGFEWFIRTYGSLTDSALGLSNSVFDMSGLSFNELTFDKMSDPIFRYGSKTKVMLGSGATLSKVGTFGKAYLENDQAASETLGLRVKRVTTEHGDLMLVRHRMFDEISYLRTRAFIFDPEHVSKSIFTNSDTKLFMNIQNNDVDGVKHEYRTKCTLEVRNPGLAHFVIKGLDNTIAG